MSRVLPTALVVGMLALSGGGCGGSDSDTAASRAKADKTYTGVYLQPRIEGSGRTGERAAAAEVVLDVQEGFVIKSGLSVCFELSHAAEEDVVGHRGGTPQSCADAVEDATDRWHSAGDDPVVARVGRVRIEGREAAVTVDHPDRGSYQVKVVKNRDWELPELDLDRYPGLVPMR